MCAAPVGTVLVFLKLKSGIVAAVHPLQQSPEHLIVELREVADCIQGRSGGSTLGAAHNGGDQLIDPVS